MRFFLCPDSFKGCLSSVQVSDAIRDGLLKIFPQADFCSIPFGDGGEGTAVCFESIGAQPVSVTVTGPYGEKTNAYYYCLPDGKSAYIESAMACGLTLSSRRETHLATTRGVGELILAAASRCDKIYLGLGGSATSDMGLGMASALGFTFYNKAGQVIPYPVGEDLGDIVSFQKPTCHLPQIIALCDVKNPLTGPMGAAAVYGPQKGADQATVARLDAGMHHASLVIDPTLEMMPGAGAAGGMGYAISALLTGKLCPGAETVISLLNIDAAIENCDVIITGEGRFDRQSLMGKVVGTLAEKARMHTRPLYVFCGSADDLVWKNTGVTGVFPLTCYPISTVPDGIITARALSMQAMNLGQMLSRHYQ